MHSPHEARNRAGQMAQDIWLSLFPHTDMPKRVSLRYSSTDYPPAEFRTRIASAQEPPQVGDLIMLVNTDKRYGTNFLYAGTVREAALQHGSSVALVEKVTASSITIHDLVVIPNGGWAGDLTRLGQPMFENSKPVRYNLNSTSRLIGVLGNAEELRARAAAHPDFPAWQKAQAAAKVEREAADAEGKRLKEEREQRVGPLRAAVEGLNAAAGEELASWNAWGGDTRDGAVELASKWLAQNNRLYTYLEGLVSQGDITNGQYHQAIQHATTLGLLKAGQRTS